MRVDARRCVKAAGYSIPVNPPLALTSTRVHSVVPEDGRVFSGVDADKPVIIIGGGKTGMDTARVVLTRFPGREVHMVVGKGTMFISRDLAFPTGCRRWWGGDPVLTTLLDVAERFDGANEPDVMAYLKRRYAVCVGPRQERFMYGIQSAAECAFLEAHLARVRAGYLVDVVDGDIAACGGGAGSGEGGGRGQAGGGCCATANGAAGVTTSDTAAATAPATPAATAPVATLVFDDGSREAVPAGAYVVNCTGYLKPQEHEYEPYMSPGGAIVSVQQTSAVIFLTSYAAYFLTHLLFLGKLHTVPLYALDVLKLRKCIDGGPTFALAQQAVLNLILVVRALPLRVLLDCGVDVERWYPLHRRVLTLGRLLWKQPATMAHCRASLDRMCARLGVRGGVLPGVAGCPDGRGQSK